MSRFDDIQNENYSLIAACSDLIRRLETLRESMGEERKDDIETINDAIRVVKMERLGEYNRIYRE